MSIKNFKNFKVCKFMLLVVSCLLLFGCDKKKEKREQVDSIPTNTEVLQNTATPEPTITKTPTEEIYQNTIDSIDVSIVKEADKTKVILKKDSNNVEYDWTCDLAYGTPITVVEKDALYLILPEKEVKSVLNTYSVCGTVHKIDITSLEEIPYTDEIMTLKEHNRLTYDNYDYSESPNHRDFTVNIEFDGWIRPYMFNNFKYPVEDGYEVVLDEDCYYSITLHEYRRLGIKQNNEEIWLGKLCYDIVDESEENVIFLPYENLQYSKELGVSYEIGAEREQQILSGKKIKLDPDDSLDLDLDGEPDRISFEKKKDKEEDYNVDYVLKVNDVSLVCDGDALEPTVTAVSLDKESIQLMIFDNGPSADPIQSFYRFENGELMHCGYIPSYDYELAEQGIEAYCESYHIQCHAVPFLFEYKDGQINEIERDFYPQGNEVKVLRDIPLYKEKGSSDISFTLKKGQSAIIVGSDLKEWVLVKDISSGETGWVKTTKEDYNSECILPDGTQLPATDLFDGLTFYG